MTLDVAGVTLGQNGSVVNEFTRTHTVRIGPDTLALVRENGVIYSADIPVKSPGAYQFRIVVRDANSKKFGTAGQFIEIPDLKKNELALSGIVLTEVSADGKPGLPPAVPVEAALSPVQFSSNPAVRRFRPGAALSYAHLIYNARPLASTRKPQITTQVRLFHDGKEVFTSPEAVFDSGQQKDTLRLSNDGVLQLNRTLHPAIIPCRSSSRIMRAVKVREWQHNGSISRLLSSVRAHTAVIKLRRQYHLSFALFVVLAGAQAARAQIPTETEPDDVVRIDANLVTHSGPGDGSQW